MSETKKENSLLDKLLSMLDMHWLEKEHETLSRLRFVHVYNVSNEPADDAVWKSDFYLPVGSFGRRVLVTVYLRGVNAAGNPCACVKWMAELQELAGMQTWQALKGMAIPKATCDKLLLESYTGATPEDALMALLCAVRRLCELDATLKSIEQARAANVDKLQKDYDDARRAAYAKAGCDEF